MPLILLKHPRGKSNASLVKIMVVSAIFHFLSGGMNPYRSYAQRISVPRHQAGMSMGIVNAGQLVIYDEMNPAFVSFAKTDTQPQ